MRKVFFLLASFVTSQAINKNTGQENCDVVDVNAGFLVDVFVVNVDVDVDDLDIIGQMR